VHHEIHQLEHERLQPSVMKHQLELVKLQLGFEKLQLGLEELQLGFEKLQLERCARKTCQTTVTSTMHSFMFPIVLTTFACTHYQSQ
jgi:hypothetical protein